MSTERLERAPFGTLWSRDTALGLEIPNVVVIATRANVNMFYFSWLLHKRETEERTAVLKSADCSPASRKILAHPGAPRPPRVSRRVTVVFPSHAAKKRTTVRLMAATRVFCACRRKKNRRRRKRRKKKNDVGCRWWESPGPVSLCWIIIHFAGRSGGCWIDAVIDRLRGHVFRELLPFAFLIRMFLQRQHGTKAHARGSRAAHGDVPSGAVVRKKNPEVGNYIWNLDW